MKLTLPVLALAAALCASLGALHHQEQTAGRERHAAARAARIAQAEAVRAAVEKTKRETRDWTLAEAATDEIHDWGNVAPPPVRLAKIRAELLAVLPYMSDADQAKWRASIETLTATTPAPVEQP